MIIFTKISDAGNFVKKQILNSKTIGFVPTMGALHRGHLELMKRAKQENELLIVSIFVNPIQFNNPQDLEKYPRDIDKDITLLINIGCDMLFVPSVEEMYPVKITKQYYFGLLENVMEGALRPGHFNGVAVVINKLFNIILPNKAYFGEKDYQQLAIINKLVEINNIPVQIIPCNIVRDPNGLALSSRNKRLSDVQREAAPYIYEVLKFAKKNYKITPPQLLKNIVSKLINNKQEFNLEYFEFADDKNLQPINSWKSATGVIGFIAVWLGEVRLIDNIRII